MNSSKFSLQQALLPDGWAEEVCVSIDREGFIEEVAVGSTAGESVSGAVIPGVPNVHCHAHQRLIAGLTEKAGPGEDSFWTWRKAMYAAVRRLEPEDLRSIAAQLYVEMLKAGYTAVGEFQYLHHQPNGSPYSNPAEMSLSCLEAAESAGIGLTLLPSLYAFGDFGSRLPTREQARFVCSAEQYLEIFRVLNDSIGPDPRHSLGVAPHSLRAVSPELLERVLSGLLAGLEFPIHIHVAEQQREVEGCLEWSGQRPVEWLLEHCQVDQNWCLVHATHMEEKEWQRLAATGAVVGLCPTTEANLGDGVFPGASYLREGGCIAIGSDSNVSVSPAEELRMLEYSQRLRDHSRNVLSDGPGESTGRSLLERVLTGGARALGRPIAAIEKGRRADFVVLDSQHPSLLGRIGDCLLDSWIFSSGNAAVRDVMVAGHWVVRDGHHFAEEEILQNFKAVLDRLGDLR